MAELLPHIIGIHHDKFKDNAAASKYALERSEAWLRENKGPRLAQRFGAQVYLWKREYDGRSVKMGR